MSHQVTTTLINTIGLDYDKPVMEWRDSITEIPQPSTEVSIRVIKGGYNILCQDATPCLETHPGTTGSSDGSSSQHSESISHPTFSPITSEEENHTTSESNQDTQSSVSDTHTGMLTFLWSEHKHP